MVTVAYAIVSIAMSQHICSRSPSLPRYQCACREMCDCNNDWAQNIEWSVHLFQKEDIWNAYPCLHYCKVLGTCVGCLCMLFPKYAVVSIRDLCVVFGVMTGKESSTQLHWVGVCVHATMCVTFAVRMVLMHINVMIFPAVRSRSLVQVSFHVHYYASYFESS